MHNRAKFNFVMLYRISGDSYYYSKCYFDTYYNLWFRHHICFSPFILCSFIINQPLRAAAVVLKKKNYIYVYPNCNAINEKTDINYIYLHRKKRSQLYAFNDKKEIRKRCSIIYMWWQFESSTRINRAESRNWVAWGGMQYWLLICSIHDTSTLSNNFIKTLDLDILFFIAQEMWLVCLQVGFFLFLFSCFLTIISHDKLTTIYMRLCVNHFKTINKIECVMCDGLNTNNDYCFF